MARRALEELTRIMKTQRSRVIIPKEKLAEWNEKWDLFLRDGGIKSAVAVVNGLRQDYPNDPQVVKALTVLGKWRRK